MTASQLLVGLFCRGFALRTAGDVVQCSQVSQLTPHDREALRGQCGDLRALLAELSLVETPDLVADIARPSSTLTPDEVARLRDEAAGGDLVAVAALRSTSRPRREPCEWRILSPEYGSLWLIKDEAALKRHERDRDGSALLFLEDVDKFRAMTPTQRKRTLETLAVFPGARVVGAGAEAAHG